MFFQDIALPSMQSFYNQQRYILELIKGEGIKNIVKLMSGKFFENYDIKYVD